VASDPTIDPKLQELATTLLKDQKKIPNSYGEMTPEQKLSVDAAARDQVKMGTPHDPLGNMINPPDPAALQQPD
jgi:hypothetical protein